MLFRASTTCIVPVVCVVFWVSNVFFSKLRSTVLADHGRTVTGMVIGALPGIWIVIISSPTLKFGYKVMACCPSLIIRLFVGENVVFCFVCPCISIAVCVKMPGMRSHF